MIEQCNTKAFFSSLLLKTDIVFKFDNIVSFLSGCHLSTPVLTPNALTSVSFVWLQLLPCGLSFGYNKYWVIVSPVVCLRNLFLKNPG